MMGRNTGNSFKRHLCEVVFPLLDDKQRQSCWTLLSAPGLQPEDGSYRWKQTVQRVALIAMRDVTAFAAACFEQCHGPLRA